MFPIRKFGRISLVTKMPTTIINPNKSKTLLNRTNSPQQIITRNASIHTRNILIRKLKLEHITPFGVTLLVSKITAILYKSSFLTKKKQLIYIYFRHFQ